MIEMPMSDAQFASTSRRLQENGIDLAGPAGTLTKDGVTAKYCYADGKFVIEIIDQPAMLPVSLIEGKLRMYLEQSVAYDAGRAEK